MLMEGPYKDRNTDACVCAILVSRAQREPRNGFMIEEDFPEARWGVCHFPPKEAHHAECASLWESAAPWLEFLHLSWFGVITFLLPKDMAIKLTHGHKIKPILTFAISSRTQGEPTRVLFISKNCLCPDGVVCKICMLIASMLAAEYYFPLVSVVY